MYPTSPGSTSIQTDHPTHTYPHTCTHADRDRYLWRRAHTCTPPYSYIYVCISVCIYRSTPVYTSWCERVERERQLSLPRVCKRMRGPHTHHSIARRLSSYPLHSSFLFFFFFFPIFLLLLLLIGVVPL